MAVKGRQFKSNMKAKGQFSCSNPELVSSVNNVNLSRFTVARTALMNTPLCLSEVKQ